MADWSNLNIWQLRQVAVWLDWAEHHSMREYEHVTGDESYHYQESETDTGWNNKLKWAKAINDLASEQAEIRELLEKRKPPQ